MNASDVLKLISSAVCCVHLLEALFRDSTVHGLRAGPSSGPLHLDSYGRPVHLAEPGRIWNVSPSAQGTGVLSASLPETPSVTIPGSTEPNLHYGTLQLKDGTVLDRSPTVPAASSASFQPVDPSLGVTSAGGQLGGMLRALPSLGINPFQLPSFSLPMLNLNLPWALMSLVQYTGATRISVCRSNRLDLTCYILHRMISTAIVTVRKQQRSSLVHNKAADRFVAVPDRMEKCKVQWPCLGDRCDQLGGRDYTPECPGMVKDTCAKCFTTKAHPLQDLSGFTEDQKADFSVACKNLTYRTTYANKLSDASQGQAEWPCRNESCGRRIMYMFSAAASYLSSERDYTHTCPEYWRFDEPSGTCQPPKVLVKRAQEDAEHAEELALMWQSYTGSYRDTGEIRRMAAPERSVLAARWGLKWPCLAEVDESSCLRDYSGAPCPRGWINVMNSGACQAPSGKTEQRGK
ncbi:uncharacterized protein LOC34618708 [Cyclospora cayetanensis]|uniref:Uncharacterized protein LOC34618708 n=1 Tax=Cyclospora cayetanensis TaxID=88456 RepID=A0A6P6S136_9EIME|nr:uncharacterized protein LOC34618708 [Cyclospora cayetanensis]